MAESSARGRIGRPSSLRAGVVMGVAVALVGIAVGTATGAATPFQNVIVTNPATNPVNVKQTGEISGSVGITNFPANQPVTVTNQPALQAVNVTNFPASQAVTGSVSVTNLPGAAVANKVFRQGYSWEDGEYVEVPFGRTINVTYIRISDVTNGDGIRVQLVTANGTEGEIFDGDAPFKESFTVPVPATGLKILCTNLVVDCNIGVFVVGT
jgi:hypothetical protein